jgi:hypothetical protein
MSCNGLLVLDIWSLFSRMSDVQAQFGRFEGSLQDTHCPSPFSLRCLINLYVGFGQNPQGFDFFCPGDEVCGFSSLLGCIIYAIKIKIIGSRNLNCNLLTVVSLPSDKAE